MRALRLTLVIGGLFNVIMGLIFLSNTLLRHFFATAENLERVLFQSQVSLPFPVDPLHQLLIHGFGAGVVILGATLLYAVRNPRPLAPFLFFDGAGRLLFSAILFYYVKAFSLIQTILVFGALEFALGVAYVWQAWMLVHANGRSGVESGR